MAGRFKRRHTRGIVAAVLIVGALAGSVALRASKKAQDAPGTPPTLLGATERNAP